MELLHSFAPIEAPDSRVLILGSMPGGTSLRLGEYYGHAANAFWPIMSKLFNRTFDSYGDKVSLLTEQGIALWDVLARCERSGSSDSAIRNPVPNDFAPFWKTHPMVELICCNGAVAMRLFSKLVGVPELPEFPRRPRIVQLPSTSPANAMPFERKYRLWAEQWIP